jgi:isoquinoline 1-oxidoreductase beta subunit
MSDQPQARIDRRHFLIGGAVIGAGLYIGIRVADKHFGSEPVSKNPFRPNAYLRVAPDNSVTVVIGKAEMGQGIYTGLAMAVAEELDVDPRRVQVEFGPVDPRPCSSPAAA